jgi:hypothetical protein
LTTRRSTRSRTRSESTMKTDVATGSVMAPILAVAPAARQRPEQ